MNELHDIVAAPAPGWWPPAPGWWVLAVVTLIALSVTIYQLRKAWLNRRVKRLLLAQLNQYDANTPIATITLTLKQGCFGYLPREQVAALHGKAWEQFLLSALPAKQQDQATRLFRPVREQQYRQQSAHEAPTQAYLSFAKWWVQQSFPLSSERIQQQLKEASHD